MGLISALQTQLSESLVSKASYRDAKCYFFGSILYCFDENTSKILQDLGKYCFFLKFIITHVYCTMGENTVFHPKYSFSALKMLQTFLQGWHPCSYPSFEVTCMTQILVWL